MYLKIFPSINYTSLYPFQYSLDLSRYMRQRRRLVISLLGVLRYYTHFLTREDNRWSSQASKPYSNIPTIPEKVTDHLLRTRTIDNDRRTAGH